jgi:3'-phosphoadenosine 5'-phosphosulfate sulfotransferase (PAPS reductase)/FAD synthetase
MLILSLGAGVQSTALLLLSANGVIPKYDAAIFSDTGWEPQEVYDHLDRLEREVAGPAGIPVYRVGSGRIQDDHLFKSQVSMPMYYTHPRDGKAAMLTRQCTQEYKLRPIHRKIRLLGGATVSEKGRIGNPKKDFHATIDIGISLDEIQRAKDSRKKYATHQFTLLDMKWTREDCLKYLQENGFAEVGKSSCIACPYRSNPDWLEIKTTRPAMWEEAVRFDTEMRKIDERLYVHRQRVPLAEADLTKKRGRPRKLSCSPFSCVSELAEE